MYDHYGEVFEMAQKLGLPQKPLWYDNAGCPRWQEVEEKLKIFVRPIRCQACGQIFRVCLVDGVYRSYGESFLERAQFSGKLPRDWHYGDAPAHPVLDKWGPDWWKSGWDTHCMGETMNSIPEYEWECWNFHEDGKTPMYKEEFLAANEKDEEEGK